jgi:hypothetical protein
VPRIGMVTPLLAAPRSAEAKPRSGSNSHTYGSPRRNNPSQEAKKVPCTAADVKYVEPRAEGQRRKELPGRRASALKKASPGSIQKAHEEPRVFGSIDLNPRVCECSRGYQRLRQGILPG